MRHLKSAQTLVVGALFLFCIGVWSAAWSAAPLAQGKGYLTFAVLDVGQGDALYIESPTGVQVVVDAGPGQALMGALPKVLPLGDRTLDAVVATHPDADHIGGMAELLRRYSVGAYISPGIPKSTATARELEETVDELAVSRVVAHRGTTLDLGGGATLEVLYPDRDVSALPDSKSNDGCIVMRLVYGETSALLACDAPDYVESHVAQVDDVDSDILKVAHHGSRYSSSDIFVAEVSPEVAIISVGKNSYGHPTAQTLNTLERHDAQILRTDQNGTVLCKSDGAAFECE